MAADFVNVNTVKSALRELASPIDTIANFNTLVSGFITDNPMQCTSYEKSGETIDPVVRGSESYTGAVVYKTGKTVNGRVTVKAPTVAGFNTAISTVLGNAALATAIGGTASHEALDDTFSCTLKCHATSGELFNITFKRDRILLTSYESDAIRTDLDAWADEQPSLA